jgi:hypothetical protein
MKRVLAVIEDNNKAAAEFFALDIAGAALLSAECSVPLVALLLQLSKRFRRQVWDFFRESSRYHLPATLDWLRAFHDELACYKDKQRMPAKKVYNLYPCFVPPSKESQENNPTQSKMRVAKLVSQSLPGHSTQCIVLRPGFYNRSGDEGNKNAHPAYDCDCVSISSLFEWYLVADAICAAFDYMIHSNNTEKWDTEKIFCETDKELLLCAL